VESSGGSVERLRADSRCSERERYRECGAEGGSTSSGAARRGDSWSSWTPSSVWCWPIWPKVQSIQNLSA